MILEDASDEAVRRHRQQLTGRRDRVPVEDRGRPGRLVDHFEVRSHDGTANPYLALAAILGAGLQGIKQGVELKIGDCPGQAVDLSEEDRVALNITGRMPKSLDEARERTRSSAAVKGIFGEAFVEKYLSVNEVRESRQSSPLAAELTALHSGHG